MSLIPANYYQKIVGVLPILCVDLIIQNEHDEYFLIKRMNEPKKGEWWVVGGRVKKGENLEEAAIRKIKEEIGVQVRDLKPVGYFEAIYKINPFNQKKDFHTISVVFKTRINDQKIILDNQSSEWKYGTELPKDFIVKPFLSR